MHTLGRLGIAAIALTSLALVAAPLRSWGQTADRVGTVLLVEGVAEVKAQDAAAWKRLDFRDTVFVNDTVRTEARSRLKLLLRDDSVWTLDEQGRMQFTETEHQRCSPRGTTPSTQPRTRLLVQLFLGKLRGITSLLFGGDAVAEVRTPNAVMCMYGTAFLVIFTPPDTSEFIGLDGLITVQNLDQAIPEIEPVPPNFRTEVVQSAAPATAVEVASADVQSLTQSVGVIEQAPEVDAVAVVDTEVALEVGAVAAPEGVTPDTVPVKPPETITPDTSPPAEAVIRNSILDFVIVFPR